MTEETKFQLFGIRSRWLEQYVILYSGSRWWARPKLSDEQPIVTYDWLEADTCEELDTLLKADLAKRFCP
jgi:hypothetical protein